MKKVKAKKFYRRARHNVSFVKQPRKPMAMYSRTYTHSMELMWQYGSNKSENNFKNVPTVTPLRSVDWFNEMSCYYDQVMPARAVVTFYGFNIRYVLLPKEEKVSEEEVEKVKSTNYEKRLKACETLVKNSMAGQNLSSFDYVQLSKPAENVFVSVIYLKTGQSLPSQFAFNSAAVKWRKVHSKIRFKFYHYFKANNSTNIREMIKKYEAGGASYTSCLQTLEELCGVGNDARVHAQLYLNNMHNFAVGIKANDFEPPANDPNFELRKYVSCNIRVKYSVICSLKRYNAACDE